MSESADWTKLLKTARVYLRTVPDKTRRANGEPNATLSWYETEGGACVTWDGRTAYMAQQFLDRRVRLTALAEARARR